MSQQVKENEPGAPAPEQTSAFSRAYPVCWRNECPDPPKCPEKKQRTMSESRNE